MSRIGNYKSEIKPLGICHKCNNLHAVFNWTGDVKISDEHGRYHAEPYHSTLFGEFYRGGDPMQWPTCPECARSLDLWSADPKRDLKLSRIVWGSILAAALLIWALVIKYFFL